MATNNKLTGLISAVAKINKQYGKNTIMRASEAKALELFRVPFGIPVFDLALGGGLPRGKISLIKGEFSSGKTLMALKAMASFHNHCRYCGKTLENINQFTGEVSDGECRCDNATPMQCVWLDAEGAFESKWAKKQGVKLEHCHVLKPEYTEQGIDVTDLLIRTKEADLIVVDSIAAMAPSIEIEDTAEKWQMGQQARLINKAMRKFTSGLNSCGLDSIVGCPSIILINQVRVKIGVVYGSPETTPGGKGQDFHSSIIARMAGKSVIKIKIDDDEIPVGKNMGFDIPKNKTASPHESGLFDFYFKDVPSLGIHAGDVDIPKQYVALGLKYGVITKKGSWFGLAEEDKSLAQGREQTAAIIAEDKKLQETIWKKACIEALGFVV